MTTIRTTCKRCGDIELTTGDLDLELAADDSTGKYRFCCPKCGIVQRKPANHRVVSILLATGVDYSIVPALGAITEDEIDAFAKALDDGGWHTELTSP